MKPDNILKAWRLAIFAGAILIGASAHADIGVMTEIIKASTGPVVLGEWNKNFDKAKAKADAEGIPMVVFYGGLSCGKCETLQKALTNSTAVAWRTSRKLVMVFGSDNSRGNMSRFTDYTKHTFPSIAVYWNRDGKEPEKDSAYYITFHGLGGEMPVKAGTLTEQFINSVELVAGEYPYAGGDFVLPETAATRLEVEAGYGAHTVVKVPLSRRATTAYVNRLVCGGASVEVAWAAGETAKLVEVAIPDGLAAGQTVALELQSSNGAAHSKSSIAIVPAQSNSLRNPAWLGEAFGAGEWTMDLDAALSRARGGEFRNTLVYFTGALWCPHCQGLEEGIFNTATFKDWAVANNVALVELDNPRRSDSVVENDYQIRTATGQPPTLLRYAPGQNNYAGRQESGASYLTRKGIAVGAANAPGTAEFVLQRNRNLGYSYGEGTYCAPGAGRTGYPTVILLNADGTVAGRLNKLEEDGYQFDLGEGMARLDALLALSGGAGESGNYPTTTTRVFVPGGAAATVDFQINDRLEYFKLSGVPSGQLTFTATGNPAGNPVKLSLVRYAGGKETVLASAEGKLVCSAAAEEGLLLKVEAYTEARRYGTDHGFTATVASSIVLVPTEKTATFAPDGRTFSLSVTAGSKYRLEGMSGLDENLLRDDGPASSGGRYYTALSSGVVEAAATGSAVSYQLWNPGSVVFTVSSMVVFKSSATATVTATRTGGSSGEVSAKIKVVGGDAENGVRYVWDDSSTVAWADGASGAINFQVRLIDTGDVMPNQSFVLGFAEVAGAAAEAVGDGTLEVTICDTDKPTLGYSELAVDMFATLDAGFAIDAQPVYNVDADSKVTIKKVDGKLPPGVKLVYSNGKLSLAGAAKKAGTFTCTFALQQKQGTKVRLGPETTLTFTVAAATAANPLLNQALKTTLPLYAEENGVRVLKGVLEFANSAKNKISAKFYGLEKQKTVFKGSWGRAAEGTVEAVLAAAKGGRSLKLALAANGAVSAELSEAGGAVSAATWGTLIVGSGNFAAAYAGYYTVALCEVDSADRMGNGYLTIKSVAADGKTKWSGKLANGQSVSGTSYVTLDGDGCAVLPILKYRNQDWLAIALKLRANGGQRLAPRAVKTCEGTIGRWSHYVKPASTHDVIARGSWYNQQNALDECCYLQFFGTDLELSAALEGYVSEVAGTASASPKANVVVGANSLKLGCKCPEIKLSFNGKTGIFKGTMKVGFSKKMVSTKFAGVVIPGWHDCHCEVPDPADPFTIDDSQPFGLGAAWFSDQIGGAAVSRGFLIKIDAMGE